MFEKRALRRKNTLRKEVPEAWRYSHNDWLTDWLTNRPTTLSWVLPEKVCHTINSQHFMEPESSLLCSQEAATGLHLEIDKSSPCAPPISIRSILKFSYQNPVWIPPWMLHTLPISYSLNSVALVRKRTIPTKQPPLVGEVSANFSG
jgi:hypothetical protein